MLQYIKEIDIAPKYKDIIEDPPILKKVIEYLWDSPLQGNVLVDREGNFVASNDTYRFMLGVTSSELHRRTWQSFTAGEELYDDQIESEKVAKGEIHEHRMQKQYRRKDGQKIWVNMSVRGLFDEHNRFLFFIVGVTPVTMVESAIKPVHDLNGQTIGVRPSINFWDFVRDNWRTIIMTLIFIIGGMLTIFATAASYFYVEFKKNLEREYERKHDTMREWSP